MGLWIDEMEIVEHAALLHGIGKICIADTVLLKPARFSHAEYEAMKQHPYYGYRIVKPIKHASAGGGPYLAPP
jgi:HD-GYP domain-containing protein (c-di-GMP phosphodiesterase class II)